MRTRPCLSLHLHAAAAALSRAFLGPADKNLLSECADIRAIGFARGSLAARFQSALPWRLSKLLLRIALPEHSAECGDCQKITYTVVGD